MFGQMSQEYQAFYQTQRVWLNDSEGRTCLSMRPDLLIYQTVLRDDGQNEAERRSLTDPSHLGHYSHVIDIKWKTLPHAGAISAQDAYQLTSYAQAYQAGQVWLVYPVLGNIRQPVALRQQSHHDDNEAVSQQAHLWLIPFDVLTGTVSEEAVFKKAKESF